VKTATTTVSAAHQLNFLSVGARALFRFPVDAMGGEPAALRRRKIGGLNTSRCAYAHLQAIRAADVGGPLVAALKHDLLERGRPAKQEPPAALNARPLLEARIQPPG